jgi:hypothetical protein
MCRSYSSSHVPFDRLHLDRHRRLDQVRGPRAAEQCHSQHCPAGHRTPLPSADVPGQEGVLWRMYVLVVEYMLPEPFVLYITVYGRYSICSGVANSKQAVSTSELRPSCLELILCCGCVNAVPS